MHTITLYLEGAAIHDVRDVPPGIEIRVLDYDVEGTNTPEAIVQTENGEALEFHYTADDPQNFQAYVEAEVARLRSLGWTREDFVNALRLLLESQ